MTQAGHRTAEDSLATEHANRQPPADCCAPELVAMTVECPSGFRKEIWGSLPSHGPSQDEDFPGTDASSNVCRAQQLATDPTKAVGHCGSPVSAAPEARAALHECRCAGEKDIGVVCLEMICFPSRLGNHIFAMSTRKQAQSMSTQGHAFGLSYVTVAIFEVL